MAEVTTIGLDIAKHVFHAHGSDATGRAMFSRRITRGKLLDFFAAHPRCLVALEACGGAHHWARELQAMGHDVRLIPPAYVKPFVKRHKNDAVDAEAICEAAQRPSMRFVAVESEQQQAAALVFRTRDLAVKQRTQLANAIRGHLTEYGWVAPKGRDLAAWLGLTPRQHSTGGKTKLLGISKRGNGYLRKQLIHGARAAMPHLAAKPNQLGPGFKTC
jgi:transposase